MSVDEDGKIVRLFPARESSVSLDVPTWLRELAEAIEKGDLGEVQGAVFIAHVSIDEQFCCKMRRTRMSFLEVVGVLQTMIHDMLHSA